MKDQLVSIEVAKLAKEYGFTELCGGYYVDGSTPYYQDSSTLCTNKAIAKSCYTAPTQSLVQKWLRENKKIHLYVNHYEFSAKDCDGYYFHFGKSVLTQPSNYQGMYSTYEKALEAGLIVAFMLKLK